MLGEHELTSSEVSGHVVPSFWIWPSFPCGTEGTTSKSFREEEEDLASGIGGDGKPNLHDLNIFIYF